VPPPGPKPFYKRAWFIVLAVLVGLGAISNAVDDDRNPADATVAHSSPALDGGADDASTQAETDAPTPRIGEAAADGDFSFVVTGVECGATTIGGSYVNTTAQGQFCIVNLTVTNIGDEAQSFFGDNTVLLNGQGQEFSADSSAAIYLEDSSSLYEEVNPGNSLNSRVVFDVPPGMVPTAMELHDSAFSGGVTVLLQ
jgi:Domain of unknown function (DUF4352)